MYEVDPASNIRWLDTLHALFLADTLHRYLLTQSWGVTRGGDD